MKTATGPGRDCSRSMDANLCGAFVINAAFYGLQQWTRIYFALGGGRIAHVWPEHGAYWFSAHTVSVVVVAFFILLWTVMLPVRPGQYQRAVHLLIVVTAALNLALAVGTHGLMATMSADGFADTPLNRALRAKALLYNRR